MRSVGATPTMGEEIMAVSYTISWQDKVEDGERSDTLYQCPLCGIAYDIDENPEWGPHGLSNDEYGDWIGLRWGHHVTDNCKCHDVAVGG